MVGGIVSPARRLAESDVARRETEDGVAGRGGQGDVGVVLGGVDVEVVVGGVGVLEFAAESVEVEAVEVGDAASRGNVR